MAERTGVQFPILYDPTADVVEKFGVYDLLNDGLATPSTFIIDKSGVIRWKYVGKHIYDRPSAEDVIAQLRRLDS